MVTSSCMVGRKTGWWSVAAVVVTFQLVARSVADAYLSKSSQRSAPAGHGAERASTCPPESIAPASGIDVSLPQAVRLASLNPARAVGLNDRGEIAPGRRADLVRVRLVGEAPMVRAVWREGERVV